MAKFTGQRLPEIQETANLQILSLQKSPFSSGAFWHRLASQGEAQLALTDLTLAEISERTGFSSPEYFSAALHKRLKTTPSELRQRLHLGR